MLLKELRKNTFRTLSTPTHLSNPSATDRMWHEVNFYGEYELFEFKVFLLLNQLPHQCLRNQSVLRLTHRFISLPRVLELCENETDSSMIELGSPCLLHTEITITLCAPQCMLMHLSFDLLISLTLHVLLSFNQ